MNNKTDKPNMLIYEVLQGQQVKKLEWVDFLEFRTNPKRIFFIQALSDEPQQLQHWLHHIDADPLVFERCIDPDANSGVFTYENMFVLQLPFSEDWVSSRHSKLTLICLKNVLIVISETLTLDAICCESDELLPFYVSKQTNVAELLLMVLDGLVDHASNLTLQARLAVDKLENDLLENVDNHFDRQLLSYKRSIAHFEIALEFKHRTLAALLSENSSFIDLTTINEPLHDVITHIEHSQRYIERIEDRLSELQSHLVFMLQGKTNQRLRILTVLSAIFMPLTLIAGIYGMNFHYMPELAWHYGYPLALLFMLGLAIGLLLYFARRGWFK